MPCQLAYYSHIWKPPNPDTALQPAGSAGPASLPNLLQQPPSAAAAVRSRLHDAAFARYPCSVPDPVGAAPEPASMKETIHRRGASAGVAKKSSVSKPHNAAAAQNSPPRPPRGKANAPVVVWQELGVAHSRDGHILVIDEPAPPQRTNAKNEMKLGSKFRLTS